MLRLAFVFPGQGAQYVGMGKNLAEHFDRARQVYDLADEILGFNISRICFEGPLDELNRTEITQPAILVTSIAIYEVLKEYGLTPEVTAGLSLGEYSALVASGALRFDEALKVVTKRGQIMQEAVPKGKGMMAAILKVDSKIVEKACQEAMKTGIVGIANYNCPGQIVISGERVAVDKAIELLKNNGAKAIPLAVSVPSHSRLMEKAAVVLEKELNKINWSVPSFPVISNVTAQPVQLSNLPEILVKQLYSPVKWEQSVVYMAENVELFLEIGPGKVLSGLIKKTVNNKRVFNIEDTVSLKRVLDQLKEAAE
jgi:[acyl-carrier-protein] S-malonyltransferase